MLRLLDPSPTTESLLGLWRDDPAAVTFEHAAADAEGWQANLPADPALARARLAVCTARLQRAQAEIPRAADQLGAVVDQHVTGEVGLIRTAAASAASAETELTAWLRSWAELEDRSGAELAFGFGVSRSMARWWQEVSGDLAGIAGQVAQACSPTALVETRTGGALVGRSLIELRGDVRTAWRAGRGADDALLHETTVALVQSTRATLLRMVAVTTAGASAIAVRLALPGGPLLALPAAWRFIQRALNETNRRAPSEGGRGVPIR